LLSPHLNGRNQGTTAWEGMQIAKLVKIGWGEATIDYSWDSGQVDWLITISRVQSTLDKKISLSNDCP